MHHGSDYRRARGAFLLNCLLHISLNLSQFDIAAAASMKILLPQRETSASNDLQVALDANVNHGLPTLIALTFVLVMDFGRLAEIDHRLPPCWPMPAPALHSVTVEGEQVRILVLQSPLQFLRLIEKRFCERDCVGRKVCGPSGCAEESPFQVHNPLQGELANQPTQEFLCNGFGMKLRLAQH